MVLAPMPSTVAPARSRRCAEAAKISPWPPSYLRAAAARSPEVDRIDEELRLRPLVDPLEEFIEVAIVRGRRLPREATDYSIRDSLMTGI